MKYTWSDIVELNKIFCRMTGSPHGVRQEPVWTDEKTRALLEEALKDSYDPLRSLPEELAERHYFIEKNKTTAMAVAAAIALERV